jgi:hypothetical protein
MGCWAVGLIFFRSVDETRHFFYAARLLAFLVVLIAIADKNRGGRSLVTK